MNYTQEEYNRELALVSCIIHEQGFFNETLFQSFDKVYDLAKKYIETHGIDNAWEDKGMDFDEHVVEFVKQELRS